MTLKLQVAEDLTPEITNKIVNQAGAKILCSHCQRTATNGFKCKGICVADTDY